MIERTIQEIEERIGQASAIAEDKRAELLQLLRVLKSEIADVGETHADKARAIAGYTERSTAMATRSEPDPAQLRSSVEGLNASVAGFEESHPKLVDAVNRICVTLSSLGI